MSLLRVYLFGKFEVELGGRPAAGFEARKVQELLSYLLLYRDRSHSREALASLLWGNQPTAKSKKYLRQALWQLQTALDAAISGAQCPTLVAEADWIALNGEANLWADMQAFEVACARVRGVPGKTLDSERARELQQAVELYRGDLLEGWYHDWCLFERERLENIWLGSLEKLMSYCEVSGEYERGLAYGERVLRRDRARERAHWRMMRLYYLAGNRTAALRQYQACAEALAEELSVKPSTQTKALLHQIRLDHLLDEEAPATVATNGSEPPASLALAQVLTRLKHFEVVLANMQEEVAADIAVVESLVGQKGDPE